MSLKNDIEMVKEELNSEEKFFEKAVVTEKFVKKYKNVMIGALAFVVVAVSVNIGLEINQKNTISQANEVLVKLEKSPSNTTLVSELKSLSPSLADVWVYSQAMAHNDTKMLESLKGTNALIIDDLVSYELAQNSKSVEALDAYASKQGAIYRDLALVQSAVLLLNDKKIDLAHDKLSTITQESSLYKVATALRHYGIK